MYAPKESNPWRYLWFIFHPDVLGLVKRAGFSVDNPVKRFNNFGVKSEYFDTFVNDCKYDFKSAVLAQSLFLYVLSEFTEGEFTNDSAQNIVDNSIRYIKNNYLDVDLKTTDISAALHINHSYLCKAFKSVKGCTIISFIKSFRLKKAVEMLVTTNQSIKEIVYSCGYNDYVYFCHEFKRVYGISASDYRKRHGESRSGFCC